MPTKQDKVVVKIFDTVHEFDLAEIIGSKDLPKTIADFSIHLAEAMHQQKKLETEYEVHRANYVAATLAKNNKLSDWKIKVRWKCETEYADYQEGIAIAERTVDRVRAILAGLNARVG